MLPTLNGRIQTRIFLLAVVGGLWTLLISPVLPGRDGSPSEIYPITFAVLVTTIVLGVGWELIYHFIQQFRWEKDWPTLFGLVTMLNEGALIWVLLSLGLVPTVDRPVAPSTFVVLFGTTWLLVWLVANGPMRVPFIHWRFRGGRLL